jgi:flagellar hook-associated protein 1 FlgK
MTLSLALDVARSKLATAADQTAVTSRNVANAGNALASRKIANVATALGGGVRLASVTRVTDAALFDGVLQATSLEEAGKAVMEALDGLDRTSADPELDASPAALVGKLRDALQLFAAAPNEIVRAQAAVGAAVHVADALGDATRVVQDRRAQADAGMASSVENIRSLLSRLEMVNRNVTFGTSAGEDVTDYLDQRDQILTELSQEIGIRTLTRADNDLVVLTDSGVMLFETRPRPVSFAPSSGFDAATQGNAVYIDGVPVAGGDGVMTVASGRLAGLVRVRDEIASAYQSQLDEIARGLIEVFAESDQSATPSLPDRPGLFTYSGAPAMPASGTLLVGLAGQIRVADSVNPDVGGDPRLLRDGGISGDPAFVYNASGAAAFSDRIEEIAAKLDEPRSFDPATTLGGSASVTGFASSSVAWLQEARKAVSAEIEYRGTLRERAAEALSRVSGVSLDEEMLNLLDLERAYQATSKLISTIDEMLGLLMNAVA